MKSSSNVLAAEFAGKATAWELPSIAAARGASHVPSARHLKEAEEAAREEGRMRGHAEGYASGAREVRELAQRLTQLIEHLQAPLKQLDAQLEQQLILLSAATAKRLVVAELEQHPEKIENIVREAVAALQVPAKDLRIHLHPQDAQLLQDNLVLDTEANWKLVPDTALSRGDCRVLAENARIDALLDTRLASIARRLLGEHE